MRACSRHLSPLWASLLDRLQFRCNSALYLVFLGYRFTRFLSCYSSQFLSRTSVASALLSVCFRGAELICWGFQMACAVVVNFFLLGINLLG